MIKICSFYEIFVKSTEILLIKLFLSSSVESGTSLIIISSGWLTHLELIFIQLKFQLDTFFKLFLCFFVFLFAFYLSQN